MNPVRLPAPAAPALALLQERFLALLPCLERRWRAAFGHLRCRDRRQEALHEMLALAWQWHVRLARRGKDATHFPNALARFAAQAVHSGRRLCGQEKTKDVLSPLAQRRRGFTVGKLPDVSTLGGNPLAEALIENTATPVPEQVSFRLDFPCWRRRHRARDRQLIDQMLQGTRTLELARQFGLSAARISQLRRAFHADWLHFLSEDKAGPA